MPEVFYHPKAAKELLNIPKKFRVQIIEGVEALIPLNHPYNITQSLNSEAGRRIFVYAPESIA